MAWDEISGLHQGFAEWGVKVGLTRGPLNGIALG